MTSDWLLGIFSILLTMAIGAYFNRLEKHLGKIDKIEKELIQIKSVLRYIAGDAYQLENGEE